MKGILFNIVSYAGQRWRHADVCCLLCSVTPSGSK